MANVVDLAADLKAIASLTTQPHRLGRTLGSALHSLGQIIPFDLAVLYRLDGEALLPVATDGPLASDTIRTRQLRLDEFPTLVRALDHGRPMALHEEHHASDEGDPYDGVLDLPHGHACMVVPLRTGDTPLGLITLDRKVCVTYSAAELSVADVYAQLVSTALAFAEQAQLLDRYRLQLELQNQSLASTTIAESELGALLERTRSPAMIRFVQLARQVADTALPVLVQGETGSGKELAARALHEWSGRARRPFVSINCAAIPENLVESELFGHTRGAFSGAVKDRPGRFVAANGGTLFLDEIGDMPLTVQAKLLRALQEGSFEPVGSDATVRVDVRVVAASHVDLEEAIRARRFREDLYFRLAAVPLSVPALRDRPEDIVDLATERLRTLTTSRHGPWILEPCALDHLREYPWPGNVRELLHTIERATVLVKSGPIRAEHLSIGRFESRPPPSERGPSSDPLLTFAEAERRHLKRALDLAQGKIYGDGGAASLLQLKPTTLQAKLKKHRLKWQGVCARVREPWQSRRVTLRSARVIALLVTIVVAACAPSSPPEQGRAPSSSGTGAPATRLAIGPDAATTDVSDVVGKPAPAWEVSTWLDGKARRVEDFHGKVVLERWFMSSECPYCSATAPNLRSLDETYRSKGLAVVGFYHHKSDAPLVVDEVRSLVNDHYRFAFPVAIDDGWKTLKRTWPDAHPKSWTSVSFLLDKRGVVRFVHLGGEYAKGSADDAQMRTWIEQLLAEPDHAIAR